MTETIMKESFAVDMYNQYAYYRCREFINAKNFKAKKNILGIFGLKNVGKTRLLKKVEECLIKEKVDVKFVSATELIGKISEARKSKDVFLRKLKKEFRNAEVVLIDGVQEIFGDDKIHDTYNRFYSYLIDRLNDKFLSDRKSPRTLSFLYFCNFCKKYVIGIYYRYVFSKIFPERKIDGFDCVFTEKHSQRINLEKLTNK